MRKTMLTAVSGCLMVVAAIVSPTPAIAGGTTIHLVGNDPACTHSSLVDAIEQALLGPPNSFHQIRLASESEMVVNIPITNPQVDLLISGGWENCSQTERAPGTLTFLSAGHVNGRRLFRISNASGTLHRVVHFERVVLTGGRNPTNPASGGAIYAEGPVWVVLDDGALVQENIAASGGGIALHGMTTETLFEARLLIREGSEVCGNQSTGSGSEGNGGGILATGSSIIQIDGGLLCFNQADRHGGGIALLGEHAELRMVPDRSSQAIAFHGNRAGQDDFDSDRGYGGAVYLERASMHFAFTSGGPPYPINNRTAKAFSLNSANFGGAIYAAGYSEPGPFNFSTVHLRNASFMLNEARGRGGAVYLANGVDATLIPEGEGRCPPWFGGPRLPCVQGFYNFSQNLDQNAAWGAGGFAYLDHEPEANRPAIRIAGAYLLGNNDPYGTAAVIDARGNASVRVLRSVFKNNMAGGTGQFQALIEARRDILFGFNTVMDNDVDQLFLLDAGFEVNVTGSILHSPGSALINDQGAIVHNGCVMSHTGQGLGSGGGVIVGLDPMLTEHGELRGGSPAIDVATRASATTSGQPTSTGWAEASRSRSCRLVSNCSGHMTWERSN